MAQPSTEVTMDELRERIRAARLSIPAERLALLHGFLRDALKPLRALDSRAVRTLEPSVTFDAAGPNSRHGAA